eukprot:504554-Pelagomonas_calceolata.AAC.1
MGNFDITILNVLLGKFPGTRRVEAIWEMCFWRLRFHSFFLCGRELNVNLKLSPGFDAQQAVAAPFIKYAEKRVPAVNGSGTDRMNLLAPYIARLFAAMMERAKIPACWKVAKITPLYKKGSMLDPGNYRMLA